MNILGIALLVTTLNLEIAILSVDLGARVYTATDRVLLVLIFALLHCAVSLAGFLLGSALNEIAGSVSRYISAAILIGVGWRIVQKSLSHPSGSLSQTNIFLILLGAGIEDLAGGVSVGTGTFGGNAPLLLLLFIVISMPVNLLAMALGGRLVKHSGLSVDFVTGLLLISVGILSVFGVL